MKEMIFIRYGVNPRMFLRLDRNSTFRRNLMLNL